ncbi:MAG: hypothetical protein AAGA58_01675 [Verrucomicrobiota bacterium]
MSIAETEAKKFRKRKAVVNSPSDPDSLRLGEASQLLMERKTEKALELLEETIAQSGGDVAKESKATALAGESQYVIGRYEEAAEIFKSAGDHARKNNVAREAVGPGVNEVKSLIRAIRYEEAFERARFHLEAAKAAAAEFEEQIASIDAQLKQVGTVTVNVRPVRPSVVATKLGYTLLKEGFTAEAKEFFLEAVQLVPNGSSRARTGLARVALAEGDPAAAERWAREALTLGKFQAKTISVWPLLVSARRKQELPGLDEDLFDLFQVTASGRVKARAVLQIVTALRSHGDDRWIGIAGQWINNESPEDGVIALELAKIFLSDQRLKSDDPKAVTLAGYRILRSELASPLETVCACKAIVENTLRDGREPDIGLLADSVLRRFDERVAIKSRHAMALGAMNSSAYDLARSILKSVREEAKPGGGHWGRATWALARMEDGLKNYSASANAYLEFAKEETIDDQFRVQALVRWKRGLDKLDAPPNVEEFQMMVMEVVEQIEDYNVLIDVCRQLTFAGPELQIFNNSLFDVVEMRLWESAKAAATPEKANEIIVRLARKQYGDMKRRDRLILAWADLSDTKKEWLWCEKEDYWEWQSLILRSMSDVEGESAARRFASSILSDPGCPSIGRLHVATALSLELLERGRVGEALDHFNWLVQEHPSHAVTAWAYYWLAIRDIGEGIKPSKYIERLRASLPLIPHYRWQAVLTTKCEDMISGNNSPEVDRDVLIYTSSRY